MIRIHHELAILLSFGLVIRQIESHGRLLDPPSRASAWRFQFPTHTNYNDHGIHCGGAKVQWERNNGKCGVCGDPFDGVRENEAGGKYATGIIVRKYTVGELIDVTVDLTANHGGKFEFRICPHNNPLTPVKQDCLDKHLLSLENGKTRYEVKFGERGHLKMKVRLPPVVTCSQCVFQWIYTAGSMWQCTGDDCCDGCGPRQEHFYGCADVSISPAQTPVKHTLKTTRLPVHSTKLQQHLDRPFWQHAGHTTQAPTRSCKAKAAYQGSKYPYADLVCQKQCSIGRCPMFMCEATCNIQIFG